MAALVGAAVVVVGPDVLADVFGGVVVPETFSLFAFAVVVDAGADLPAADLTFDLTLVVAMADGLAVRRAAVVADGDALDADALDGDALDGDDSGGDEVVQVGAGEAVVVGALVDARVVGAAAVVDPLGCGELGDVPAVGRAVVGLAAAALGYVIGTIGTVLSEAPRLYAEAKARTSAT